MIRFLFILILLLMVLDLTRIIYLNIYTHSLPYGIYMKIEGIPKREDYAATCLTTEIARYGIERNYLALGICPTGTVRVLKIIKGLPGDDFIIKNGFLELNGYSYPIMQKDSSGRSLKIFYENKERTLPNGKYMLLSDFVKDSWDSRYWGPVSIQFLLKPLWIFENARR